MSRWRRSPRSITMPSGATARKPRDVGISTPARCTLTSGGNQGSTPCSQYWSINQFRMSPTVVTPGSTTSLEKARRPSSSVSLTARR